MNTSHSKVHVPSYLLGVMTGVALACCGCLLLGLHIKRSIEHEHLRVQALAEIQAIEGSEAGRQPALDTLANTYAHLRMGLYTDPQLLARIEASARKHEDLAQEIEKRRPFWEKSN
jgi:hypothetical protein